MPEAKLDLGFEGIEYRLIQMTNAATLVHQPELWSSGAEENVRLYVNNALIESFLSNARGIAYFLVGRKDDVSAVDFLPTWPRWTPAGKVIGLVSDTVAHAKYLPKPDPWQFRPIAEPLLEGMAEFVARLALADSPWATRFGPQVEGAAEAVRRLPLPPQV